MEADAKQFLAYCDTHQDWALDLIATLVTLESPTDDKAAVDACGRELKERLRELGATVHTVHNTVAGEYSTVDRPPCNPGRFGCVTGMMLTKRKGGRKPAPRAIERAATRRGARPRDTVKEPVATIRGLVGERLDQVGGGPGMARKPLGDPLNRRSGAVHASQPRRRHAPRDGALPADISHWRRLAVIRDGVRRWDPGGRRAAPAGTRTARRCRPKRRMPAR